MSKPKPKSKAEERSASGQYQKGAPGRPKGTKNKITRSMVEDVLHAYQDLGGVAYLVNLGTKDPALFVAMLKRLIPRKTDMEVHGTMDLTMAMRDMSREELERLAHATEDG